MLQKHTQTTYHLRRVVEYRDFFVGEPPIDVCATLKLFSRKALIRVAAILTHHYGNMSVPNNEKSLFSDVSRKHIPYLNKCFKAYYKKLDIDEGQEVVVLTFRTGLELWRQIFAIHAVEYTDTVEEEDFELLPLIYV